MHPAPPTSTTVRGRWAWVAFLVLGTVVSATTNFVIPDGHAVLDWSYLGALAASGAAVLVGIRLWKPPPSVRRGWSILAAGILLYLAGDVLWVWYARRGLEPFPSPADVLFVGGSLVMVAATMLLVASRRNDVDRPTQVDTLIVGLAVAVVLWTVTVEPYAVDPSLSLVEQIMSGAYPIVDVLLVATIARLLLGGGGIPSGFVLLIGGLGTWTVTDVVYYRQELAGMYTEWGMVDFGYMMGFVLTGAAALRPSSATVADVGEEPAQLGRWRVTVLAGFAASPLALIVLADPLGIDVDPTLLAVAGAVLIGLVVARTWALIAITGEVAELRGHTRFKRMIQHTTDAIVVIGEDRTIGYASPALATDWGWTAGGLVGRSVDALFAPDTRLPMNAWLDRIETGNQVDHVDGHWLDAEGTARAVSVVASDLRDDPFIGGIVVTGRDLSHRVELEEQLRHEADHDALTGLANRATFARCVDETLARANGATTSVVFVDVDDFKDINDGLGHSVGDDVLCEIGRRLQASVRPDDLVARLGGDEFGVVLADTTPADAALAARRLSHAFDDTLRVGLRRMKVSISVGWYDVEPGMDAEAAIRNSDLAMYRAKNAGKGRAVAYQSGMLDDAERRLDLRARLGEALARDEFHVAYQRIVRISDGSVTGMEALLRWQPEGEPVISPLDFIPLAEETGEIVAIGTWVLERACHDAMDWTPNDDGVLPVVSVNVSAVQLEHDFASVVATALTRSGLPADRLQLELTESLLADEHAATVFCRLSELGVRLAIDDFGTGYSSLGYLRRFSVDVIKIDRQLVAGCGNDARLLSGVAALVASTGAVAVAEGVEDALDRDRLDELGITLGQGFYWHRPTRLSEPASSVHSAG